MTPRAVTPRLDSGGGAAGNEVVQRIDVDGIPVRTAPGPERITAALVFGVGSRDETFPTREVAPVDGSRGIVVVGRNLCTVVVPPQVYGRKTIERVIAAVRAHVPAERWLRRPAPEPGA